MRKALFVGGFLAASVLAGCGGGGGSTDSTTPQTATGYFIDAPAEGIEYSTSSGLKGTTGKDGKFIYKKGDEVTFKVGNIVLGSTKGSYIVTPLDLVGTDNTNDTKVKNIAGLVLYLDKDGDPNNGISVDPSKIPNVSQQIDLSQTTNLPQSVQNAINNSPVNPKTHLDNTIKDITKNYIAGTYSGSYVTTNNPNNYCATGGTAEVTVDASGNVSGTATDSRGNTFNVSGQMKFRSLTANGTAGVNTTWSGSWSNNTISGTWQYKDAFGSCSGTFSVTKQ